MKTRTLLSIFILVLAVLIITGGCATTPKTKEERECEIILDSSLPADVNLVAAWSAYASARAQWYEEKFFETHPSEREYRHTFEEEIFAREVLARIWSELSQKDASIHNQYLDELVLVFENDYLKEYVFFYFEDSRWNVDHKGLRMIEFIQWAEKNIPQHKPETRATIRDITSNQVVTKLIVRQLEPVDVYSPSDSKLAREYYNKGVTFQKNKDYEKAIDAYLKAIELDNQFTDAMDNVGVCYRILVDYENAIKYYKMSLEILPENDVALINIALVYRMTNEYEKTIEHSNRLIECDPEHPEGYFGVGGVYQDLGNYKKSVEYMDIAIEKYAAIDSPYIYDAYYMQGKNYGMLEDFEKSLLYFEKAQAKYTGNEKLNQLIEDLKRGLAE